jgi:competence protein ComEA
MKTFLTIVITALISLSFSFFTLTSYAAVVTADTKAITKSVATPAAAKTPIADKVASKQDAQVGRDVVNINTGDVDDLVKLNGVGVKKAESIIAWRKENGNFKSVDDLLEVKGIGEATLEANRKNIRI